MLVKFHFVGQSSSVRVMIENIKPTDCEPKFLTVWGEIFPKQWEIRDHEWYFSQISLVYSDVSWFYTSNTTRFTSGNGIQQLNSILSSVLSLLVLTTTRKYTIIYEKTEVCKISDIKVAWETWKLRQEIFFVKNTFLLNWKFQCARVCEVWRCVSITCNTVEYNFQNIGGGGAKPLIHLNMGWSSTKF